MIQYGRHSIDESDVEAVTAALRSDWLTTGPLVKTFESELEKVVGAPTVSVTSGTAALHCAYAAIGISSGDEIITPPITFIATQATAALMGARIVFADVLPDTGNIDPISVEAAISKKTKAIVAVDFAGHPADLEELRNIADKYGVYLIEDAAHSIGSVYKGQPIGSIADLTTFSFFPTKNLTTSEGGAISSPNPELLNKAKKFSRQGLVRNSEEFQLRDEGPWHQEVQEFGLNYRLPDVLCALGISQLNRLPNFKNRRREVFDFYSKELGNLGYLKNPTERDYVDANWHLYPIQVPASQRARIFHHLKEKNIGAQVNYLPAHLHPVFHAQGFRRGDLPVAEAFYDSEISLPIHFGLSQDDLARVVEALKEIAI
jgi:UDP-4-amino-4,6-dideoxy-N-acetyl-beta-L-altrosamine transaminase